MSEELTDLLEGRDGLVEVHGEAHPREVLADHVPDDGPQADLKVSE